MWAVARRVAAAGTCVVGTAFVASQERSFGLSDEEDDGQARISGGRHAQPTARQLDGERKLREWHGGLGARAARLNRGDIEDIDPHRHVVAMIGITGGGKSSTANTLMSKQRGSLRKKKKGRHDDDANSSSSTRTSAAATRETARGNQNIVRGNRNRRFKEANSLTSVTRSVSFRDYEFSGVPFRVIDTPGLADTNRTADEVEAELDLFRRIARFGVTAFVIVLPRGRITPEDENTLEQLFQIFGDSLKDHAIVVFTSALRSERLPSGSGAITKTLMTRDVLLEEIDHLEAGHFLRRLVTDVKLRVVGVENKLEPHRTISCMRLNQLILDVDEENEGERYNVANIKRSTIRAASVSDNGRHSACTYEFVVNADGDDELLVKCPQSSGLPRLLARVIDATRE